MTDIDAKNFAARMPEITREMWKIGKKSPQYAGLLAEWNNIWNTCRAFNYKITRGPRLPDGPHTYTITKRRGAPTDLFFEQLDLTPAWETRKGNCTTRAITYMLRDKGYDYAKVRNAQDRRAKKYGLHFNSRGLWEQILFDNGYKSITLRRRCEAVTLAKELQYVKFPILIEENDHVSIIDKGKIVDSWNSCHKRVEKIIVAEANEKFIKAALIERI